MGRLAEIRKEYAGTGLQFLGIVMDVHNWEGKTAEDAKHYISSTGADFPQLGADAIALTENVSYIPSTHIYNSSGTMVAKVTGEHSHKDWINIIETLLAKY